MFFSFDGIDGVGKTTQIELFADWLIDRGHDVEVFRDPGGTELSEVVRDILLGKSTIDIGDRTEMLLYMASRAQLVEQRIIPSIQSGKTVITDRYVLATLAYQGHAGEIPRDEIEKVAEVATQGFFPQLTFLLDMDPDAAMTRRSLVREPDRMEARGDVYLRRVREGFLAEAQRSPSKIVVVDAGGTVREVQTSIQSAATSLLDAN